MTTVGSDSPHTNDSQRSFKFREAVLSDVGLRRNENQDAFSIVHTSGTSLYIVADGMGGARGGATASSIAVHVIAERAFRDNGAISRPSLKEAVELANTAIFQRSKRDEDLAGMGTTVVVLAFVKDVALLAHVGDSRIYHIRVDTVRQLTRDHTLVQELVDSGAIPIEEAESHPIAHMLTRSLGPAETVDVEIQALGEPLESGDKFLLCSDGLYNLVSEQEILREISSKTPSDATRALIDLALERGGTDNVTVQIVEVVTAKDESLKVDYPANGEMKVTDRQGVEFGGMERLFREVDEFQEQQAELREQVAAKGGVSANGDDEMNLGELVTSADLDLVEDIDDDNLPVDSLVAPLPQVEAEPAAQRMRLQVGLIFVVGLFAGVLAFAAYQMQAYSGDPGGQASSAFPGGGTTGRGQDDLAVPGADVQRDQLDEELENFATTSPENGLGSAKAGQPVNTPLQTASANLPNIPAMAGTPTSETPDEESTSLLSDYMSQLSLTPPPRVVLAIGVQSADPTRPIVWEHEAKRVERLLAKADSGEKSVAPSGETPDSTVSIFSGEEIYAMVGDKEKIRERISDLDSKLETLMIESKEDAEKEFDAVGQSVAGIRELIVKKEQERDELQASVTQWKTYKVEAAGKRSLELIAKLGAVTEELQGKKSAFDEASTSYFSAVDRWEKNPSDLTLASEMGALGRKLQSVRGEFETSVKSAVDLTLRRTVRDVVSAELELAYLGQLVARLSRKEGFLKGFVPFSAERKATLRDAFMNERNKLVENFSDLENKISADEEINFRRRWHEAEQLGTKIPQTQLKGKSAEPAPA